MPRPPSAPPGARSDAGVLLACGDTRGRHAPADHVTLAGGRSEVVGADGFEPSTSCMSSKRSPPELSAPAAMSGLTTARAALARPGAWMTGAAFCSKPRGMSRGRRDARPTCEEPSLEAVNGVIDLRLPARQTAPLIFASPHSGTDYDPAFIASSRLDEKNLRRSEDSFVDEIFAGAPESGAPLLCALYPRAYLDPNREPYELDPEMFSEPLPSHVKTRSDRVRAGFGTIARMVASGAEIYAGKMSYAEAERRIDMLYRPYHRALEGLIEATLRDFGAAFVLDCHSMPSVGGPTDRDRGAPRPDIVLGDRFGASCKPDVVETAERILRDLGFSVRRNEPYAGAFTTAHYGQPGKRVHALQIEVNRRLYMNEATVARSRDLPRLKKKMNSFIAAMAEESLELVDTL